MDLGLVLGIGALILAVISGLGVLYYFFVPGKSSDLQSLMGRKTLNGEKPSAVRQRLENDTTGEELEKIKKATIKAGKSKKQKISMDDKFFQAGLITPEEKAEFYRMRVLYPIVFGAIGAIIGFQAGWDMVLISAVFGAILGVQAPFTVLDRKIIRRHEDILYYLPLVIEQIAIGVSSSLDIGPCIARVVSMADERDSHNSVTELLRHAQYHVKSGVSLEQALNEIGKRAGQNELKHAFMALSQVAKHGGEITRQLQELADAVSSQRETKIDAKIKKLELQATGPVALAFVGFILILVTGFGVQIKNAFK